MKRLMRSRYDKTISGVCGGLANYFDIDPLIIRLIFIFSAIFSFGAAILAYIILWVVMPEDDY